VQEEARRRTEELMLEVDHLSKSYGPGIVALRDLSFALGPGSFGLLGPNGAGKSTLMRILATLTRPDEGEIRFGRRDVTRRPEVIRRRLGYLPQSFGVYPRTTAWQLLDYIAVLKGIEPKRARHEHLTSILAATHLSDDKDRAVAGFSGGMKQRFGLAQALLGAPEILILDEPCAGLDPYERNHVHQIIGDLAQRMIVILSTHLVADVASLCGEILLLDQGEKRFQGPPAELVARLRGRVWAADCDTARLREIERRLPVLSVRFSGGRQTVHVCSDTRPEGFAPVAPDLEDAYFASLAHGGEACAP